MSNSNSEIVQELQKLRKSFEHQMKIAMIFYGAFWVIFIISILLLYYLLFIPIIHG